MGPWNQRQLISSPFPAVSLSLDLPSLGVITIRYLPHLAFPKLAFHTSTFVGTRLLGRPIPLEYVGRPS